MDGHIENSKEAMDEILECSFEILSLDEANQKLDDVVLQHLQLSQDYLQLALETEKLLKDGFIKISRGRYQGHQLPFLLNSAQKEAVKLFRASLNPLIDRANVTTDIQMNWKIYDALIKHKAKLTTGNGHTSTEV